MAPRPAPGFVVDQRTTDEIHAFCDHTCEGTANPDFCYDACWKFRKALLMPLSAGSAPTSQGGLWPQSKPPFPTTTTGAVLAGVFAQSTTSVYYGAQATGITASPSESSSTPAPTAASTDDGLVVIAASTSTDTAVAADNTWQPPPGSHPPTPPPWLIALAVVIPLIILGLIAGLVITCVRAKRTRRALAQAEAEKDLETKGLAEMEEREPREDAYMRPPSSHPPSNSTASESVTTGASLTARSLSTSPAHDARPSLLNRISQPVILSNTINGGYFTGIDTADAASLRSQPAGDIYPNHDEEPPPPYRPASVPPISRDSSTRSHAANTQPSLFRTITNRTYTRCLTGPERHPSVRTIDDVAEESFGVEDGMRNPFEDPHDEPSSSDEKRRLTLEGEGSGSSIRHRNSIDHHDDDDDDDRRSVRSHLSWDEPVTRERDSF